MTTLEAVGIIVAVSVAMMALIPLFVFLIFKAASAGTTLGRHRATQLIQKEKSSAPACQDRDAEEGRRSPA